MAGVRGAEAEAEVAGRGEVPAELAGAMLKEEEEAALRNSSG